MTTPTSTGKRRALRAAGWMEGCRWTPTGQPRKPERWYRPDDWRAGNWQDGYTLGAAFKQLPDYETVVAEAERGRP